MQGANNIWSRLQRLALLSLCAAALNAQQQTPPQEPPEASASVTETSEVPKVPGLSSLLRGANGGISLAGVHDAQTGWATLAQPAVGYSFSDIFSADITFPVYLYRLAGTHAVNPRPDALLVAQRAEIGDVLFSLHAQFLPKGFDYEATISATAPTGDTEYGLSTGRATFDFTSSFSHGFKFVTPSIELGVGDSSSLVNPLVVRDFTSLGPLAHFSAGVAFPLPLRLSFSTAAYEQLPIGDQKIYQSVPRRNGPSTLVVTGRSVSEDNGFTNSLDLALDGHTTLSGYYSRSLRLKDDVVSVGITYVLRSLKDTKKGKVESAQPEPAPPAATSP